MYLDHMQQYMTLLKQAVCSQIDKGPGYWLKNGRRPSLC